MAEVTEQERGTADRGVNRPAPKDAPAPAERGTAGTLPATATSPEKTPQQRIAVAIKLFEASPTSRDNAAGKAVLAKLKLLLQSGKITFAALPTGLYGESSVSAGTITMNQSLLAKVATSSIWMVHEAYHLAGLGTRLYIDEEIGSRELQAKYTQNLLSGITLEGQTYQAKSDFVLEAYQKNQIIDWVLSNSDYADKEGFLTQAWLGKHIGDWGGPANRSYLTLQRYIKLLLREPSTEDAGPVARAFFALLEPFDTEFARTLIKFAGNGDLAAGIKRIHEIIEPHTIFGTASARFRDRITAWQNKTGIDLGFEPLPPPKSETAKTKNQDSGTDKGKLKDPSSPTR